MLKIVSHALKPTLFLLVVPLLLACDQKQTPTASPSKILQAALRPLRSVPHGKLEVAGEKEDQIHVLTLWGTPYEMGKAYGTLLQQEVSEHLPNLIRLMTEKMGQPATLLDQIFAQAKPFVPEAYLEEMRGIADGSGLPLQDVIRANFIGEASEWHCSLFGAWGKATAADGHLVQLRSLDYETGANIQKHPVIAVYFPETGHPFANIGWAGVVGCVSGVSSARLAISEIGDDYDRANDSFAGMPFMLLLREILQYDTSLDEAIDRVRRTPRTTSLMYGIGDGELGQLRGLQTSRTLCNVFAPDNLEPLTESHPRLEDVVYWGMSWNVPKFDRALHDKLVEYYGNINAEVTINNIVAQVGTGNLQTVVYDLTAMKMWVANARADGEAGPLEAYNRQFVEFDLPALFSRDRIPAAPKASGVQ